MKTIVLTGGGTAGHIMPNLALLSELKKNFETICYIGAKGGLEETLAPKYGLQLYLTDAVKLDRAHIMSNFKIPFKLKTSIDEAKKILAELKPDLVFSKGGYVSLPVCFAAKKLNIPVVIHESDYSLGLANKIVASFAKKVLTSFKETCKTGILVGNPVRDEIFKGDKTIYAKKLNLSPKKNLLFFGGSLGASSINNFIYQNLDKLCENYNILHIAGKTADKTIKHNNYYQFEFVNDIEHLFALADLVIARGGASSLAELSALNKKTVVVPLPKGASRGDQLQNAESYKKLGKVEVLLQENLNFENLNQLLSKLLAEKLVTTKSLIPNKLIVSHLVEL